MELFHTRHIYNHRLSQPAGYVAGITVAHTVPDVGFDHPFILSRPDL